MGAIARRAGGAITGMMRAPAPAGSRCSQGAPALLEGGFQTIAAPVLSALLYLLIFSHVLEARVSVYGGRFAIRRSWSPGS